MSIQEQIGDPTTAYVKVDEIAAFVDEHHPELRPPLSADEAEALTQLYNGDGPHDSTKIADIRFDIMISADRMRRGTAYDERSLVLNGILREIREVFAEEDAAHGDIQLSA